MKLGVDIDGLLANFAAAYQRLHVEISGEDLFHPGDSTHPPVWDWPELRGYSKDVTREVWKRIQGSTCFWFLLDPLPNVLTLQGHVHDLEDRHDVYFVTCRPGRDAKKQTEDWLLYFLGMDTRPTVIITGPRMKGLVAKALGFDAYVDDNFDNCMDCMRASPSTRTYLMDRSYNQVGPQTQIQSTSLESKRIPDLEEFLRRERLLHYDTGVSAL